MSNRNRWEELKEKQLNELNKMFYTMDDERKEFGYDSLCLRYKLAREAEAKAEIYTKKLDPFEADRCFKLAQRDCLKFYEILDTLLFDGKKRGLK